MWSCEFLRVHGEASASLGIRLRVCRFCHGTVGNGAHTHIHENSVGRPTEGVTLWFFGMAARHIINFSCCAFVRGRCTIMVGGGGGGFFLFLVGKIRRDEEEASRASINLTISRRRVQTRSHIHHSRA